MSRTYYHGTFLGAAVESLSSGGALAPFRPSGASAFPMAEDGLVHLSPDFRQAAEYAFMRGRADWPDDGWDAVEGHVFAFEDLDLDAALPDEDDLGLAVKRSACIEAGLGCESGMNLVLVRTLDVDPDLRAALLDASRSLRLRLPEDPSGWSGARKTRLGAALRRTAPVGLLRRMVDAGASIATTERPVAVAAWSLPRLVFSADDAVPAFDRRHLPAAAGF